MSIEARASIVGRVSTAIAIASRVRPGMIVTSTTNAASEVGSAAVPAVPAARVRSSARERAVVPSVASATSAAGRASAGRRARAARATSVPVIAFVAVAVEVGVGRPAARALHASGSQR